MVRCYISCRKLIHTTRGHYPKELSTIYSPSFPKKDPWTPKISGMAFYPEIIYIFCVTKQSCIFEGKVSTVFIRFSNGTRTPEITKHHRSP